MSNLVFPNEPIWSFLERDELLTAWDFEGDTEPMPTPLDSVIAAFDDEDAVDVRDGDLHPQGWHGNAHTGR